MHEEAIITVIHTRPPTPPVTNLITRASSYAATLPELWILSSAGVPLSRISSIISLRGKEEANNRVWGRSDEEDGIRGGYMYERRGEGEVGPWKERKGERSEAFAYYTLTYVHA